MDIFHAVHKCILYMDIPPGLLGCSVSEPKTFGIDQPERLFFVFILKTKALDKRTQWC